MKTLVGAVVRTAISGFVPWLAFLLLVMATPHVFAQIAAPTITIQPQNITINPGYAGSLTVTASGTGTLSYRWFKGGVALADGGGLTGALTAALSFSSAKAADAGNYSVVVSNSGGSVTSNAVLLTVAIVLPPVITGAATATAPPSAPFTYAITATNSPTSFGATGLPGGLTIDTVSGVISGTPLAQGLYSVSISATNAIGTATATLTLTVEAPLPSYAARRLVSALPSSLAVNQLAAPAGLAVDADGTIFVADAGNHTIAKISPLGVVTTIAGKVGQGGGADGAALSATFLSPRGLVVDRTGNLFVADTGNHAIRKITPDGTVSLFAGAIGIAGSADGAGASARFFSPEGIAIDAAGVLYVADTSNHTIRAIGSDGMVSTIAGTAGVAGLVDGAGRSALFYEPCALVCDSGGVITVADRINDRVRNVSTTRVVTTVSGSFPRPSGVALDPSGNLFIAAYGSGSFPTDGAIWEITPVGTKRKIALSQVYQLPSDPLTPSLGFLSSSTAQMSVALAGDGSGGLYWATAANAGVQGVQKAVPFFPVSITSPLINQTTTTIKSAQFSVTATGSPLSYAWYGPKNLQSISPTDWLTSTGSTLSVSGRLEMRGASFWVTNTGVHGVVVYNVGSYAVSTAQLTVLPAEPRILSSSSDLRVTAGETAQFSVSATAGDSIPTTALSYTWRFNGTPIFGATSATLTLASVTAADAGDYSVTVTASISGVGSSTTNSAPAKLTVIPPVAPQITIAPQPVALRVGGSTTLSVVATGSPAPTYQWNFNGAPIVGATSATLTLSNAQLASAGSYTVTLTNLGGSVTSAPVAVEVITTRLVNLSARGPVGGGNILSVGFVTNGSTPKRLLVRGIGPTLATFSVGNALSDPQLTLFDAKPSVLGTNISWGGSTALSDAFGQVGAFPLPGNSADAALLRDLPAGLYSAHLSGVGSATGVGLAEIYDADNGDPAARLVNLSASGFVGTGGNVLIAGFVITGNRSAKILVRAIGPTLASFGVSGALSTSQLALYDFAGKVVASNATWGGDAALSAAFTQVGAFALSPSSNDSALLATLPPGSYTALVNGSGGATGTALVEVYEVP